VHLQILHARKIYDKKIKKTNFTLSNHAFRGSVIVSFLGLDIGTSAVKAVIVDDDGRQISEADHSLTSHHPVSGWSEQNPDDWVDAVEQCCKRLRKEAPDRWQHVRAIGLSGQMHGATLLGKDQLPIRPAILWNDSRSAMQCDVINQRVPDIETRAGIFAMPGFTAPKILWCADHEPTTYQRIRHVLLPKDYVRLALTGELATDRADAAGTLWLNQATREWDDELCAASRTDRAWLPKLFEGTEISGQLRPDMAKRLGLPSNIPVAGGGGDAAAGALGIGAINEGDAFASLGTSGQLFVSTETYRAAPASVVHCYAHCVPDRWFQMACMLNGASPMSWFAGISNRPIAELLQAAKDARSAPLFLPYLTGERTPHNDANIRGSFYGLEPSTTYGECMKGVVEAIAYTFCDAHDCLAKAGTRLDSIAAIGGGSRSDLVLQTMSDAMGLSIQRYQDSASGPALGAARLAMVASGEHALEDVALTPVLETVFEPRGEFREYHKAKHQRWKMLYEVLKPFAASGT